MFTVVMPGDLWKSGVFSVPPRTRHPVWLGIKQGCRMRICRSTLPPSFSQPYPLYIRCFIKLISSKRASDSCTSLEIFSHA